MIPHLRVNSTTLEDVQTFQMPKRPDMPIFASLRGLMDGQGALTVDL